MRLGCLPCSRNAQLQKGLRGSRQAILLARRAPTVKRWSLDARSKGQPGDSLWKDSKSVNRSEQKALVGTGRVSASPGLGGWNGARSRRQPQPIP